MPPVEVRHTMPAHLPDALRTPSPSRYNNTSGPMVLFLAMLHTYNNFFKISWSSNINVYVIIIYVYFKYVKYKSKILHFIILSLAEETRGVPYLLVLQNTELWLPSPLNVFVSDMHWTTHFWLHFFFSTKPEHQNLLWLLFDIRMPV